MVEGLRVSESKVFGIGTSSGEGEFSAETTEGMDEMIQPIQEEGPVLYTPSSSSISQNVQLRRGGQRKRTWADDLEKEKTQLEIRFLKLRNKNLILKNKKLELQIKILEENLQDR